MDAEAHETFYEKAEGQGFRQAIKEDIVTAWDYLSVDRSDAQNVKLVTKPTEKRDTI